MDTIISNTGDTGIGSMADTGMVAGTDSVCFYFGSTSSIAFRLGPSIMTARVFPILYGCSRNLTPSLRSFAIQTSRFETLSAK